MTIEQQLPALCTTEMYDNKGLRHITTTHRANRSHILQSEATREPGCQLGPATRPSCSTLASGFKAVCFVAKHDLLNKNRCLPCDAWQRVGGDEGERRFVSLSEPNGVLAALLGVQEHSHVQAAGTLPPLQPGTQYPGAAER